MRPTLLALAILLTACPKYTLDPSGSVSGFTDGDHPTPPPTTDAPPPPPVLTCPGETQCACADGCLAGQLCGPTNTCTTNCASDDHCKSGVSGEACIGGMCGVPCDPGIEDGGCGPAGMPGAICVTINPGEHYCGYLR